MASDFSNDSGNSPVQPARRSLVPNVVILASVSEFNVNTKAGCLDVALHLLSPLTP